MLLQEFLSLDGAWGVGTGMMPESCKHGLVRFACNGVVAVARDENLRSY